MLLSWTLLCDPQSYLENFRLCFAVAKRGLFPFNRGGRGNFEKILRVNFPRIWKSSARDAATKFHVAWYQQMRLHEWNTMTREDTWSKRDTFFFLYIYYEFLYYTQQTKRFKNRVFGVTMTTTVVIVSRKIRDEFKTEKLKYFPNN